MKTLIYILIALLIYGCKDTSVNSGGNINITPNQIYNSNGLFDSCSNTCYHTKYLANFDLTNCDSIIVQFDYIYAVNLSLFKFFIYIGDPRHYILYIIDIRPANEFAHLTITHASSKLKGDYFYEFNNYGNSLMWIKNLIISTK